MSWRSVNPTFTYRVIRNLLQEKHGFSERTLLRRLDEGELAFAAFAVPEETWYWEGASEPSFCKKCGRRLLAWGLWCAECEEVEKAEQMREFQRAQWSDVDN